MIHRTLRDMSVVTQLIDPEYSHTKSEYKDNESSVKSCYHKSSKVCS